MSEQVALERRYMISVYDPDGGSGLVVAFVPRGLQAWRGPNGEPTRVKKYIVVARQEKDALVFDWTWTHDDPESNKAEMEAEARARWHERRAWIERVGTLIDQVEQWARQLNWSTRRVEKNLDDAHVGKHRVPALLMQEDTCRILLEPVGRSAPGTEGVVDLYLMPAYDDIAGLYYYEDRWNLHYLFGGDRATTPVRAAEGVSLSKETLEKVLAEMKAHAA